MVLVAVRFVCAEVADGDLDRVTAPVEAETLPGEKQERAVVDEDSNGAGVPPRQVSRLEPDPNRTEKRGSGRPLDTANLGRRNLEKFNGSAIGSAPLWPSMR
jgi:hypothetical protein